MRVFLTGGTGFIGQPVVKDLIESGHTVLGLARSDSSADILKKLGAEVQRGDLEDLEALKSGSRACDGVIHLAFIHDFNDFVGSCTKDKAAIEAMGDALAGTGKPLVTCSGTLFMPSDRLATEDDQPDLSKPMATRAKSEKTTLDLAQKGVRSCVCRLSPTNYGAGDHVFMAVIMGIAKQKGESAYIGDGQNRWPATHRLDAAKAFRLVLEKGQAGSVYHPIGEEGVKIKDVAEIFAKKFGIPCVSKTPEEAKAHFGFLAAILAVDNPVSSVKTRKELGWAPVQHGLLAALEKEY